MPREVAIPLVPAQCALRSGEVSDAGAGWWRHLQSDPQGLYIAKLVSQLQSKVLNRCDSPHLLPQFSRLDWSDPEHPEHRLGDNRRGHPGADSGDGL